MMLPEPERPPAPDPRVLGLLVAEVERLRDALRAAASPMSRGNARQLPPDLTEDERRLVELLGRVRDVVLSQPAVGHALTTFLVAEGRRFAATDDGAAWAAVLRDAPEVERLSRIWEATTLNVFDDHTDSAGVPDAWVDLLSDLASIGRVDRVVAALLPDGLA